MNNNFPKRAPFTEELTPEERTQVEQRARAIWKARKEDGKITAEDDWFEAITQLKREHSFPGKWVRDAGSSIRKMLGLEGKTPWDLFQALIIPITLVVIGFALQEFAKQRDSEQQEAARQQEQQLAEDKARQETLVRYLAEMSEILGEGLLRSPRNSEIVIIAQAKTVTALQSLDAKRQQQLLQFLLAANLNTFNQYGLLYRAKMPNSDFRGTNLNGAVMIEANLYQANFGCRFPDKPEGERQCSALGRVNLNTANLSYANFRGANLSLANLKGAGLSYANLTDTFLSGADFTDTTLYSAILQNAILLGADLSASKGLNQDQLAGLNPPFLCATKLPADLASLSDRDCDRLLEELMKRFPRVLTTSDEAKRAIEIYRRRLNNQSDSIPYEG